MGGEGEGEASREEEEEEEAMRCPGLQTSLPLTGHSLATRSALNSPDTAQNTAAQSKLPKIQPVHKLSDGNVENRGCTQLQEDTHVNTEF